VRRVFNAYLNYKCWIIFYLNIGSEVVGGICKRG